MSENKKKNQTHSDNNTHSEMHRVLLHLRHTQHRHHRLAHCITQNTSRHHVAASRADSHHFSNIPAVCIMSSSSSSSIAVKTATSSTAGMNTRQSRQYFRNHIARGGRGQGRRNSDDDDDIGISTTKNYNNNKNNNNIYSSSRRHRDESPEVVLTKFLKYTAEGRDKDMKDSGYKPTYDSVGYYKLYASDKMELRKMRHKFTHLEGRHRDRMVRGKKAMMDGTATDGGDADNGSSVDLEMSDLMKEYEDFEKLGLEPGIPVSELMDMGEEDAEQEGKDIGNSDDVNEFGIRKRRRQRMLNLDHLLDEAEQFLMGKRVKGYGEMSRKKTSNPFRVLNDTDAARERFKGTESDAESMGKSSVAAGYAPDSSYREKSKNDKMMDDFAKTIFDPSVILSPNAPQGSGDDGRLPPNFPTFSTEDYSAGDDMQLKEVTSGSFFDDDDPFVNPGGGRAAAGTTQQQQQLVDEDDDYDDVDNEDLYEDVYLSEEAVYLYRMFMDEYKTDSQPFEAPPDYITRNESLMWGIDHDEIFDMCEGNDKLLQTDESKNRVQVPIDDNPSELIKGKMLRDFYQIAKAGDVMYSFGRHPISGRVTRKRILFETDVYRINQRTPIMQRAIDELHKKETVSQTVDQLLQKISGKDISEMTEDEITEAAELMRNNELLRQSPELQELHEQMSPKLQQQQQNLSAVPLDDHALNEEDTDDGYVLNEKDTAESYSLNQKDISEHTNNNPYAKFQSFFDELGSLPSPDAFKTMDPDSKALYAEHINRVKQQFASLPPEDSRQLMDLMMREQYEQDKLRKVQEFVGNDNLTMEQVEMLENDEELMRLPVMQEAMERAHSAVERSSEIGKVIDQLFRQAEHMNVDMRSISKEKYGVDLTKIMAAVGAGSRTLGTSNAPISTADIEVELNKMHEHTSNISNDEMIDMLRQKGLADEDTIRTLRDTMRASEKYKQ